jgi:hypothetical protein
MPRSSSKSSGGWRDSILKWFQARVFECVHCSDCQSTVLPFASHCPKCGQANPARVSNTAAIFFALGIVFVTLTLSLSVVAF